MTTDPCILLGDVNASILGCRTNYASPIDDNPVDNNRRPNVCQLYRNDTGQNIPTEPGLMDKTIWRHQGEESEVGLCNRVQSRRGGLRRLHGLDQSPTRPRESKLRHRRLDIYLTVVNEICSPLAQQILEDHQKGYITSGEGVALLLDTPRTTLLQHQPVRVTQRTKIKLQAHRNEEQRESKAQIVTLQKALDNPLHNKCLSIAAEASFTIMDLQDELMLSREIMQTVVRDLNQQMEDGRKRTPRF
jgi:hypothetical protein